MGLREVINRLPLFSDDFLADGAGRWDSLWCPSNSAAQTKHEGHGRFAMLRAITKRLFVSSVVIGALALLAASAEASGGGGGGGANVDTIKVSKCYYDAPTGEMLIKAASSDPTAR